MFLARYLHYMESPDLYLAGIPRESLDRHVTSYAEYIVDRHDHTCLINFILLVHTDPSNAMSRTPDLNEPKIERPPNASTTLSLSQFSLTATLLFSFIVYMSTHAFHVMPVVHVHVSFCFLICMFSPLFKCFFFENNYLFYDLINCYIPYN